MASSSQDAPQGPRALLEEAEKYKQEGNTHFKAGNLKRALGNYHKVFCYINGLQIPGEKSEASSYADMLGRSSAGSQVPADKVEAVKLLKQSTHLNMAACYLKQEQYQKCVAACAKALAAGEPTSKAYFRRGQAQLALRSLDEAKADFEEALRLEPENAAIKQEMAKLKRAFAQHDAKEKKKFAKMFDTMEKENAVAEAARSTSPDEAVAATAA